MTTTTRQLVHTLLLACAAAALCVTTDGARAQDSTLTDRFLLIREDLTQDIVQIGSLDQQKLHYLDAGRGWRSIALEDCLALLRPNAHAVRSDTGTVQLSDGQVLPGVALSNADPARDALAWDHLWIGRMELPLGAISAVTFSPHVQPPPAQAGDVVLLSNGDQLAGIIVELGDPVVLDIETDDGSSELEIPVERVAAVSLVSKPRAGNGRRLWLSDGTIINVRHLLIGDDSYVRFAASPAGKTLLQAKCPLADVQAVLFRNGALTPLATLEPATIDGPPDRFTIPAPRRLRSDALGNLSPIEFRGPLTVRYMLPAGVRRFAASATLPVDSRTWGDCQLIIECDGREVFSQHLSAETPTTEINTAIDGREFAIRLTAGARGPIQDRIIFDRAMFLVDGR